MIAFVLSCSHGHKFEGWFRSGNDYDAQHQGGALTCPVCGDQTVDKAPMAPAIVRSRGQSVPAAPPESPATPDSASTEPAAMESEKPASAPQVMPPAHVQLDPKTAKLLGLMRQVQKHVERNFENVGTRFADEARAIHQGDAEKRGIWGQATIEDAKALHEEGIDVAPMPRLPKLDG